MRVTDPLDERSPYLVEGIRLFRAGEYFLAHETLEEHWAEAPASERPFLQGLFDSDGHVGPDKVCLANTSLDVIRKTHALLRSLGIFASRRAKGRARAV